MVRVTGPVLAADAAGSLGGELVFSSSKGRHIVKRRPTPNQPNTGGQKAIKAFLGSISFAWSQLPTFFQAVWEDEAQSRGLTTQNFFIQWNCQQLRRKLAPCVAWPPSSFPASATWATPSITKLWNGFRLDWNISGIALLWFILIAKRSGPGSAWAWNDVRALVYHVANGPGTWTDLDPVVGNNEYRFYLVSTYQDISTMEHKVSDIWP
jgi:hypothetical protein